jgi:AI-2E family transporter
MKLTRPIVFWIATCAAVIAAVVLLREILLPFVAGLVLAYLFNPLANRLERLGLNRLLAALVIIGVFIVGVVVLISLTTPIIARELAHFLDNLPLYFGQLKSLTSNPDRPWLRKIVGEGLASAEQSIGELATLGADWFGTLVRSVWTGGRALISVFSLAIVMPVVAGYLIYDWNNMLAAIDNLTPPSRRPTVRALASEIDDTIGGFVRGQGALCLILCVLCGGAMAGRPQSQPSDRRGRGLHQLRALSRLDHRAGGGDKRGDRAILAELVIDRRRAGDLRRRSGRGGLCTVALPGRPSRQLASGVDDLCVVRIRIHIRDRRAAARGAARGGMRGAPALRAGAVLCKPALYRPTGRGRANRRSNTTSDR